MKLKQTIHFFDSATRIISLIWVVVTWTIIILIKVFDVKVSEYLERIPLIHSILNMDLIQAFEDVDEEDVFYVALQSKLKEFMDDTDDIESIQVKEDGEGRKIFKITMKNGEQRMITVTKDWDEYKFDIEVIKKLFLQRNTSWFYTLDNNFSFGGGNDCDDQISGLQNRLSSLDNQTKPVCPKCPVAPAPNTDISKIKEAVYLEWYNIWKKDGYAEWHKVGYAEAMAAFGYWSS